MNKEKEYETYPLYLGLSGLTFALLTVLVVVLMYVLWPGLHQLSYTLAVTVEIFLAFIIGIGWFLWAMLGIATKGWLRIHPIILRISNRVIYSLFPISLLLGKFGGVTKDRLRQSMIDLINHLVTLNLYKVPADRILLLTPHCLQESSCVHKVTGDVYNCKQCGRCKVGDLLQITKDYGCKFLVATGGTLARLKVKEVRPKAIVAIACERDLASGMADVFPIPVIGVVNARPNGPCCNTTVDADRVREVVELLVDKDSHERN